jgi:hypothetical protein
MHVGRSIQKTKAQMGNGIKRRFKKQKQGENAAKNQMTQKRGQQRDFANAVMNLLIQ